MSTSRNTTQTSVNPGALRQDDERRRDEARLAALQNQVDELRQALREVLTRQAREEELLKHFESATAQNRMAIDQIRQEGQQTAQARALDENRTRQQIADLDARIEDVGRPIRSLQAHVMELVEAARLKADDTQQYRQRDDELQAQIERLSAHVDRTGVLIHQVRDSIDAVREETDGLRRDIIRAEDGIKIVDQEARRRVTEVAQGGEMAGARIDELRSDLGHLFDLIDDTRRSIVHIDPSLEELRDADAAVRQEIGRVQAQGIERHELLLERVEDLNEAHRELSFRIGQLSGQLDELRLVDSSVRRDLWLLNEQRVRLRLDQAQQELDLISAQRRDTEADTAAGRVRRPSDH
jgi:chromosome segregation ATPase